MSEPTEMESPGSAKVVVITGATGVVGIPLANELLSKGYELRVLSRFPDSTRAQLAALNASAPIKIGSYDDRDSILSGADAVIHLAARNNDQGGGAADFERDNCELTLGLAQSSQQCGASRFIFATSTKALNPKASAYASSKAKAEASLNEMSCPTFKVSLARMAPVYGQGSRGKIRLLNSLPLGLNKLALLVLRSFLPIVSVDRVAKGFVSLLKDKRPLEELCLSDPLGRISIYGLFIAIINLIFILSVLTILSIPALVSAVAVAVTTKGDIFFVHRRVGSHQRVFNCRKFRTMRVGTPIRGTHEVETACVTKVGAILRNLKLDELPQTINLMCFEMNLIGPRPCLENQSELIEERERYGVFCVRPGITGLGQVSGVDMSEPHRLSILDHRYAAFRGILMDIKIAIATLLGQGTVTFESFKQ